MFYLEVIGNEKLVSATTNQEYMRSKFAAVKFVGERTIIAADKTAFRMYNVGKEFPVGTLMEGQIVKLDTTDYEVEPGKVVNSITVCVVGDENPVEIANAKLQRDGEDVWVITNGKSTKPTPKTEKPAKAEKPAKVGP